MMEMIYYVIGFIVFWTVAIVTGLGAIGIIAALVSVLFTGEGK